LGKHNSDGEGGGNKRVGRILVVCIGFFF
jgi:hypothetical protein